jgi:prepilin-type N-terminal cleavage/methylation domain-containing protein
MAHKLSWQQRGDTLVEVLMAVVIISVVIVGAITMMNRGLAAAQVALEHSQVRLSINGQIDMLTYARDSYVKIGASDPSAQQWAAVIAATDLQAVVYDNTCNVSGSKQAFYMTAVGSTITRNNYTPSTPPTVATPGTGMWIESVKSPSGITPAYTDFVIRACWQASGSTGGQQRTVTAVRLYDPTR